MTQPTIKRIWNLPDCHSPTGLSVSLNGLVLSSRHSQSAVLIALDGVERTIDLGNIAEDAHTISTAITPVGDAILVATVDQREAQHDGTGIWWVPLSSAGALGPATRMVGDCVGGDLDSQEFNRMYPAGKLRE